MDDKLRATVQQTRGGASVVKLSGVIDEHNGLGKLKVETSRAVINLAGVERINSTGARDWVNWLASLEARGVRPALVACSPAVVSQLNLVKNFARSAVVKSFQAPYHCAACDVKKLMSIDVGTMAAPYEAPPCECDECGAAMAFDAANDTYFAFLAHLPPPPKDERPSSPDLARGSDAHVLDASARDSRPSSPGSAGSGSGNTGPVSRPSARSLSDTPLPAVQLPGRMKSAPRISLDRISRPELPPPRVIGGSERPYLIVVVLLLFAAVGLLGYLLLAR